jgi:hypothetical protein
LTPNFLPTGFSLMILSLTASCSAERRTVNAALW